MVIHGILRGRCKAITRVGRILTSWGGYGTIETWLGAPDKSAGVRVRLYLHDTNGTQVVHAVIELAGGRVVYDGPAR